MNRTIPIILAVALFMEQVDSTVIATSLPAIAADIGTDPIALKLALTAYLVSVAIFIPISGWLADRFGARRIFCIAIGIFMAGSIACTASGSLVAFVAARFLQGMGGAMMTPIGRLMLVRLTPRHDLVGAMSWLAVPALIGPMAGPPLGGFLTTYFSWHWIFLLNIPVGMIGILFALRFLPEIERRSGGRMDFIGFLLSGVAASGIVFGLSVVSLPALPPQFGVLVLAIGLASLVLYIVHARRSEAPLLDLVLFRNPAFRAAIFGGSAFRIGVGAVPFLLPLMFQLSFGMTPFESGLVTLASAIGAIGLKFFATRILRFAGFRRVLIVATIAGAVMIGVNAWFTPQTPISLIVAILIAGGFFRSLCFTAVNALIFADTPDEHTAQASATASVAQQISIAVGVAVAGVVLEAVTAFTGEPLGLGAFQSAFVVVAFLSGLAALAFVRLDPATGARVSGHRIQPAGPGGRTPIGGT